jgi:single-strand DNA-binding protein
VNTVALTGNLATNVELRDAGSDAKVANFVLAVDRPGAEAGADFFRITAWNRQAELCERYLAKGRRAGVEGRLRAHSWEDADGKKRTSVEVVANRVEFLSPPDRAPAEDVPFEAAAA